MRWPSTVMPPTAPGGCWPSCSRPAPASTPRFSHLSPQVDGSPRTRSPSTCGLARSPSPPRSPSVCARPNTSATPRSRSSAPPAPDAHWPLTAPAHQPGARSPSAPRGRADPGAHPPRLTPGLASRLQSQPTESRTQDRPPDAPTPRRPTRPSPRPYQSRRRLLPARRRDQPRPPRRARSPPRPRPSLDHHNHLSRHADLTHQPLHQRAPAPTRQSQHHHTINHTEQDQPQQPVSAAIHRIAKLHQGDARARCRRIRSTGSWPGSGIGCSPTSCSMICSRLRVGVRCRRRRWPR